jgi:hypothetical protein
MNSRIIITLAAVVLLVSGLALLFAPQEIVPDAPPLIVQFLAAALLGLGAADWIARSSSVGGIYGRAITIGNLVAFGVTALSGLRATIVLRSPALVIVTTVAIFLAACFTWLMIKRE